MKKQMWLIFGGAIAAYIVIVLLIAVIPAIDLSQTPPGPDVKPLTPLEDAGRTVFASEGCGYCHSQYVRPLPSDKVFGRPSAPGDFAYQTPELLGSERTGPDLTNVGNRRGEIWQYMHLWDPRSVSPGSIMPNFRFVFQVVDQVPAGETAVPVPAAFAPKTGKVIPTARAKALVAYLMSLKQTTIPGFKMNAGMGGPASTAATSPPASATAAGGYAYDAAKGKQAYDNTCSACHQATGEGVPGAFPPLAGNPVVNDPDSTTQIHTVLDGKSGKITVQGASYNGTMPGFASQLSDIEIANLVNYERSNWGNHGKPIAPADVAAIHAGKKLSAPSSAPAGPAPAAASASTAASGYTFDAAKGRAAFDSTCAACHQATGEGVPGAFPPLKGNAAVDAADPTVHIDTILHGSRGSTIGGVKYPGAMPPFGGQLNDEDIANIANYERSSWGNHAKQVTPAEIAAIRAKGNPDQRQ